jgi:HKD family nuclease
VNVQLLTPNVRGAWLERVQRDIAGAAHFVLITAFVTSDGIALIEKAIRTCLEAGGQGTLILALDQQRFNGADAFGALAALADAFPHGLEVRVVPERSGLLHAKAVFAKVADGSATLLVGSANLTQKAFTQNQELGLWVDLLGAPEVSRAFQQFAQNLGGTRLEAGELRRLARHLAGATPAPPTRTSAPLAPWTDLIGEGSATLPVQIPSDTFVGDWLGAGNIVSLASRDLDMLVIRAPIAQLQSRGLIKREATKSLTTATVKTSSTGYLVRLLPEEEDERLRKDSRRESSILGKLSLNLPCFGRWMPKPYWDLYRQATARAQAADVSTDEILKAAERRRRELESDGMETEVNAIADDFRRDGRISPGCDKELRVALLSYFRSRLAKRPPALVARAVGFRTGRMALAWDVETDPRALARSFFVDVVQSTFAATYISGSWPQRFGSFVGRTLAARIAERCLARGEQPNDELALQLLDDAANWEDARVDFETVTTQVNKLLGEPPDFAPVAMADLISSER